ncbi:TolC family protein [Halanaerobaculum tunisiense]
MGKSKSRITLFILILLVAGISTTTWGAKVETENLTQEDLVELVLNNNSQIKALENKLLEAEAKYQEVKAQKLPSLDFNYGYTKKSDRDLYHSNLAAQYPLYTSGRIKGQLLNQEREIEKMELELEAKRKEIILAVRESYYNLLKAKKLKTLAAESLTRAQTNLEIAQSLYQSGATLETDVLESQVRVAEVEERLIELKNRVDIVRAKLKKVVGVEQEKELAVKGQLKLNDYKSSLAENIKQALNNRADLKKFQLNLKQAKTSIELAQSEVGPQVNLKANYNLRDGQALPEQDSWDVGVVMSLPLYDGGASAAKEEQANEKLEQLHQQYWQLQEGIKLEVKEAYLQQQAAQEKIQVAEKSIARAERNLEIKRQKYKEGALLNSQVIDAEVAVTETKTNYLEAVYDYQIAVAKLFKAIGLQKEVQNEKL